ncbi:MAG: zinc ribbon domain-containing protein [bacterium]|nr:MAG: zinc ribbon domain-containing protein [bacterium]
MTTYSIYELTCPDCGIHYAQMISDKEEHLPISCPSCEGDMEKGRKLTGAELLSCGITYGGG